MTPLERARLEVKRLEEVERKSREAKERPAESVSGRRWYDPGDGYNRSDGWESDHVRLWDGRLECYESGINLLFPGNTVKVPRVVVLKDGDYWHIEAADIRRAADMWEILNEVLR